VGTARTALYNYLFARKNGGTYVLRLEDTDEIRSSEVYTKDIIDGLHWLDLNWDEGPDIGGPYAPYRQTQKIDRYQHIAEKLIKNGSAYFCYCTQEELAALKDEQKESGKAMRYDNRCREIPDKLRAMYESEQRIPAIRFRINEPQVVSWHDGIKGEIAIDTSDLGGDMVIVKSNGVAIYNFAVVVDDIDMKMTDVIRGEDHIHNTAKQLLLYEALDETPPRFAHPALIFDIERRKLSKRLHGELVHVDYYRENGYMPEAIVNYLGQMSLTAPDGREIYTLEEACEMFDLSRVSKSPAVFDVPRLNWFNSHYIRSLPLPVVTDRALPYLSDYKLDKYDRPTLEAIVACLRDGLTMLSEIKEAARFFFEDTVVLTDEASDTLRKEGAHKVLLQMLAEVDKLPVGDAKGCKAVVDKLGKDLGVKGKDLYWPIRAALTGSVHGPDLGVVLSILGHDAVRCRIKAAVDLCSQHQTV
jgi:glutamyl-tRNA synthetase